MGGCIDRHPQSRKNPRKRCLSSSIYLWIGTWKTNTILFEARTYYKQWYLYQNWTKNYLGYFDPITIILYNKDNQVSGWPDRHIDYHKSIDWARLKQRVRLLPYHVRHLCCFQNQKTYTWYLRCFDPKNAVLFTKWKNSHGDLTDLLSAGWNCWYPVLNINSSQSRWAEPVLRQHGFQTYLTTGFF